MDERTQMACRSLAGALADAARGETLRFFRQTGLRADNKAVDGFDPVTEGDRAAEEAMRALIETRRPSDGILGEEFGQKPSESGLTWVLDPIDGTRGYVAGTPTWGTLIALHDGIKPVLGVIDQPYIGERFIGGLGEARMTGPQGMRNLYVSGVTALEDAMIFTTFPEVGTPDEAAAFRRVAEHCKLTRYGMDCYAYALLAAGQIDLVIEAGLQPYDIQAPIAVVEAAGGIVTNWTGGPADKGGQAIAAATPELHAAAMALLDPA
ncbi:histidinol-phosphatase [uncultured Litoreibacter sp.]|uniref:histidinol-phosphatase n=1 Tax=uncultured Litoreibacter sp. TaxID=1392394 RepID=UPI00260E38A3|nr:histidinol-phosphatase [uncultured Litoreibacter sp.]